MDVTGMYRTSRVFDRIIIIKILTSQNIHRWSVYVDKIKFR